MRNKYKYLSQSQEERDYLEYIGEDGKQMSIGLIDFESSG
jgi:hypothetical protein